MKESEDKKSLKNSLNEISSRKLSRQVCWKSVRNESL